MKKKNVERYIKALKKELSNLEKEGAKMEKENQESPHLIWDLREHYYREERLRGKIQASEFILNNC